MASSRVPILNSGGLRSLVATALTLSESARIRAALIYVADGREGGSIRIEHARRQAAFFSISRVSQIEMPHLYSHGAEFDGRSASGFAAPQLLLAVLSHGRAWQAERLVWPVSRGRDVDAMARATEQIMLCDHLGGLDGGPVPVLEAPLLELSDRQIVELGSQLEVPWHLAWSCRTEEERPCGHCPACLRRRAAFDEAGLVDAAIVKSTKGRPSGASQPGLAPRELSGAPAGITNHQSPITLPLTTSPSPIRPLAVRPAR